MATAHDQFGGRLMIREAIKSGAHLAGKDLSFGLKRPTARGVAQPTITITPAIELTSPNGRVAKIGRVKIFTATTKMRCGSFSLPAGPPSIGGTCPASTIPKGADPSTWVCSGCYATSGNYQFTSVQVIQAVRKEWVRRLMAEGPEAFVDAMSWALAQYLASPRLVTIPLPGDKKARVEMDRRFFRIHDSGDFSWQGDAYALAWAEIARRFHGVRFWAPTRDWVFKARLEALREASRRAPNLAIRPSALVVGEDAPHIPGLAAGTSVAFGAPRKTWNCPAYAADEHSCATGINPEGKVGCRVCWIHPDRDVNYNPHGTITDPKLVQLRVRKNPAYHPPLAELYAEFERTSANRSNRGEARSMFAAWLAEKQIPSSSFAESEWIAFLQKLGVGSFDEEASYLEETAEWG